MSTRAFYTRLVAWTLCYLGASGFAMAAGFKVWAAVYLLWVASQIEASLPGARK